MAVMTLYEMATNIRHLIESSCEGTISEDGEIPPETEKMLDSLNMAVEEKVAAILAIKREKRVHGEAIEGEAKAVKAEYERLQKAAAARYNEEKRLDRYLIDCFAKAGITSIQTTIGKVAVQLASTPSVTCPDELVAELPEWCKRTKVETSLDKKAIVEAQKLGTHPIPPGVKIERSKFVSVR